MFDGIFEKEELGKYKPVKVWESPRIISFDEFLTSEECDALIAFGFDKGFERR